MLRKPILFFPCLLALFLGACSQRPTDPSPTSNPDSASNSLLAASPHENDALNNVDREGLPLPATDSESGWASHYDGKLGGNLEISLQFNGLGDYIKGTVHYKKADKKIAILGRFLDDGTFFFREFLPDGFVTGIYSGSHRQSKLIGSWYAPGTEKEMEIDLDIVTVQEEGSVSWPFPSRSLPGVYAYNQRKDGPSGYINVEQKGQKYAISISCNTGYPDFHSADVPVQTVGIEDHQAILLVPTMDCKLKVNFFEDCAFVDYIDEHTDCGFGLNATVEGEYIKIR